MSFVVTKLVTDGGKSEMFLLGSFSTMKLAAAAAIEVYKDYNKNASFRNLEIVEAWLSTHGEYSFRQDRSHRLQLDISMTKEDEVIIPAHQRIYSIDMDEDREQMELSKALCPDGVSVAERK